MSIIDKTNEQINKIQEKTLSKTKEIHEKALEEVKELQNQALSEINKINEKNKDDIRNELEEKFQKNLDFAFDMIKLIGFYGVLIGLLYQSALLSFYGDNIIFFSFTQAINDSILFFFLFFIYYLFGFSVNGIIKDHKNNLIGWSRTLIGVVFLFLFMLGISTILFNVDSPDKKILLFYYIFLTCLPLLIFILLFKIFGTNYTFDRNGFLKLGLGDILFLLVMILVTFSFHLFSYNNKYEISIKKDEKTQVTQTGVLYYKNDKYGIIKYTEKDEDFKVVKIDNIETFTKKKNNLGH